MPNTNSTCRGDNLHHRLLEARRELQRLPSHGARSLPVLNCITATGHIIGNMENGLMAVTKILVESGRIFLYGNSVVMEWGDGED